MCGFSLLVGNGINNLSEGFSWEDVLNKLGEEYSVGINIYDKPFPLAYEEIYLNILKRIDNESTEGDIKSFIANQIKAIMPNDIHKEIAKLNCQNIITTNYDLAFEKAIRQHSDISTFSNQGVIKEQRYNVFRHHQVDDKKIWHIHGDITIPNAITLGYEHYSGHLQSMRNYTTTGSHYTKKNFDQKPLVNRINNLKTEYSWIDNFFLRDIYIIGLTMDFVEIDLWWLLTFRERNKYLKKSKNNINNNIIYYLPACFLDYSQCGGEDVKRLIVKTELLKSVGAHINTDYGKDFKLSKENEREFYLQVVADIRQRQS